MGSGTRQDSPLGFVMVLPVGGASAVWWGLVAGMLSSMTTLSLLEASDGFWVLPGRVWSTGGPAPNADQGGSRVAVGQGGQGRAAGGSPLGTGAPPGPWPTAPAPSVPQGPWHPLPDAGLPQLVGDGVELGRLRGHRQPWNRGQHAGTDWWRHGWNGEAHTGHFHCHRQSEREALCWGKRRGVMG